MAYLLAGFEIMAVFVDQQTRPLEVEFAAFGIHVFLVGQHVHDVGDERVVRTQGQTLAHLAFQGEGRLRQHGSLYRNPGKGFQLAFLELIEVPARFHAAPVGGLGQGGGGEVDAEFAVFLYQSVGMAFGTHGNVAHGRFGAEDARPCHGNEVVVFPARAAPHQYGGQRIEHRAGLETLLGL